MLKTLNALYKDRIEKVWTESAREASAEARRGGSAIITSSDAQRHFGVEPKTLIPRYKPMKLKSAIDRNTYNVHSFGMGAYLVKPA